MHWIYWIFHDISLLFVAGPARRGAPRARSGPLKPLRQAGALSGKRSALPKAPEATEEEAEERRKAQEEAFKLRLAPYERAIQALEEKQRLYDDQETKIQVLSKSLEDLGWRS